MKQAIVVALNELILARLDEYCERAGLSRDLAVAIALDRFLDETDTRERKATLP